MPALPPATRRRRPAALAAWLAAAALTLPLLPTATAAAEPSPAAVPADVDALGLVPQPVAVELGSGAWQPTAGMRIAATGAARPLAQDLAEELRTSTGFRVPVPSRPKPGDLQIVVDPDADYTVEGAAPTEESYVLDVTGDGATLTATTAHGAHNGIQTLRQLMPAWVGSDRVVNTDWSVPAVRVEDAPRFEYRGVMLDVARSFQDVDMVKRYIDTLAGLKASHLHLHLADDQGWRIEITNEGRAEGDTIDYTRLTEVSGKTSMNENGYQQELGRSGYYTQEEYVDIVEYARDHFITVVPEIDVPGHTNSALHAIPELNTERSLPAPDPETGVVDWNGTGAVGYSALDEQHQPTYDFVNHVFGQIADLTQGPLVHVGGDESTAMGHERYVDFVSRAVPEVRETTGAGVMGWTEFAEAGLSEGEGYWEGSVVHYWVGSGDWVRDFVSKGGKAVVSDASRSYLDMKYDAMTPIGYTWACSGDCDYPRYYEWDPTTVVEGGLAEEGILGVEAPMWSETIRGEDQAMYMALPRAAAILETGWTQAEDKDVDSFSARLGEYGAHLTVNDTNYYESRRAPWQWSLAGLDATVRRGRSATIDVGLVAAPGTKLSADGTSLVPDTSTDDGDPASQSVLTEPLSAVLVCGDTELPVTFTAEETRNELHAAGTYTAHVTGSFTGATDCELQTSAGESAPVSVSLGQPAAQPDVDLGEPTLEVEEGPIDNGAWFYLTVEGFAPEAYLDVLMDDTLVYRLRTDEQGRFDRTALVPRGTTDGEHELTIRQGDRSAEVVLDVESDILPAVAVAADGTSQEIDAVNPASRTAGMLALYTPAFGDSTQTDQSGGEAVLEETETPGSYRVIQVCTALTTCADPGNNAIPENGVVLSAAPGGDPDVRLFLRDHIKVGDVVELQNLIRTATTTVDGVNLPSRGADQLVVYTSAAGRESTGTNEWGYEVTVVDGRVVGRGGNDQQIPDDGYVLSGHGLRATWLSDNAVLGARVELDGSTLTVTYIAGP
ncbi:beta-N-acetylhexosaminidase [Auraticoccus monumenti]|uniref:beta-N-acetylhexosaminidase n=1 Tax=Auraticoccus monumenti TaxID=675864 RepID=A0A1G6Y359_9ACTN|nr:beta-N-acetylhexosaminidase [Auraticoccus monumenti]SDD84819.1 N-acetyl-beta-hexosaminidase [Auraticoccus monumenti]